MLFTKLYQFYKRLCISKFKKNRKVAIKVAISKKRRLFSRKSSFSRDVGVMRYVCLFGVLSISPVCTICLQSDLSLESVQSVNLTEKWKFLFVSKKVFSKSLLFLEM